MASILDWFRKPDAKAVTGPGAYAMTWYPSTQSLSRDPNKLMAEAEALYRQPWVNVAERAVTSRLVRLPWHLETDDGDTVDDTSQEPLRAVLRLLERPNRKMTRRQLWSVTSRHLGLTGNSFWFLDQADENGAPLEILYINPARMTPALDAANNVIGWMLDGPENSVTGSAGNPGVPLMVEEVIHFRLDEPDFGVWGIGLAEAAQRKISLAKTTDGYIAGVLGSGGRITGILAPKDERTQYTEDEFKQYANDWRRIVEDPNAAKRLQISKKPVEMVQTSMSPRDLLLPDVAKMARDDVLGVWGVPLSQVGIPTPAGLNSGEKGKYDEAAIMQGPVRERGDILQEKAQYELLDRFNLGLQVVIDHPEFDDRKPLFEAAELAKVIPLRNRERRELIGLDPLDDEELDEQVWIASTMTQMGAEPETPPTPLMPPPPASGEASTAEEEEVVEDVAKAKLNMSGIRTKAEQAYTPRLKEAVRVALANQRGDIARSVKKRYDHLVTKASDTAVWWNAKRENERLGKAILPLLEDEARTVGGRVRSTLILPAMKADSLESVVEFVRERAGERIADINDTTREEIARLIETGVSEGLSPSDLATLIEDSTSFNDSRAELIARTETMLAYNDTALRTFGQYDVAQVQAIDGDDDAVCASRNGNIYSLEDALNISDHPNGTLDWIPVVA